MEPIIKQNKRPFPSSHENGTKAGQYVEEL